MTGLQPAARIHVRVVWALMLRETKTLFGRHKLGYLWALINAAFSIGIFWAIRDFAGFHAPHGLSTPVFLVGGFIPWYLFSETVTSGMNSVGGNRALLAYPQVFPLDIQTARALLQGAMYVCVMAVLLGVAHAMDYRVTLHDPARMLAALSLALLLGYGTGTVCSALNLMWPTTARVVPLILRVMFFVSGLFFSVDAMPRYVQRYLFFNPVSHVIESLRSSLSASFNSRFVYLPYVIGFVLVSLLLGLLLERYSRRYMEQEV
ncbi:MAG: ABC transporter permease [Desulfobacterales bacterium]|jgi:capsular polysaccharide transport system permease protein